MSAKSENRRPRSGRSQPSREGARREDPETGGYRRDDRGESRGRAAEVHEVVTDAVAAVDGMIAAHWGVGKLAAAVATARRPTGAARALVSFVGPEPQSPARKPRVPEPPLPDDVTGQELDRSVHHQLRTLTKENAEGVARHLVMVAAPWRLTRRSWPSRMRRRLFGAGRVPAAREALGMVAYRMGDYNRALGEFRTVRRLSGSSHLLALMVDCERGLGRFDRALSWPVRPRHERSRPPNVKNSPSSSREFDATWGRMPRRWWHFRVPGSGARVPSGCSTPMPTGPLAALRRADEALDWFTQAALGDVERGNRRCGKESRFKGTVQTDLLAGDDSEESGAEDSLGTEDPDVR